MTTSCIDDFLDPDPADLSDPEDFEEAFLEGCEPRLSVGVVELRLSVGVVELRPSAAAASALRAELRY